MSKLKLNQIFVELWPSHLELPATTGISKHKPLFAEFHESLDKLLNELESLDLPVEPLWINHIPFSFLQGSSCSYSNCHSSFFSLESAGSFS